MHSLALWLLFVDVLTKVMAGNLFGSQKTGPWTVLQQFLFINICSKSVEGKEEQLCSHISDSSIRLSKAHWSEGEYPEEWGLQRGSLIRVQLLELASHKSNVHCFLWVRGFQMPS